MADENSGRVAIRREDLPSDFQLPSAATVMLVKVPPKLLQYAKEKEMRVIQINGQRFFGPLQKIQQDWTPPKGSEIFVGKLPRYMTEDQLFPIFEQSGEIFQMRLMMDFSGTTKGYCFVRYYHPDQAKFAIRNLNGFEIKPGKRLVAVKSADNCKLLLGGLPMYKSEKEMFLELSYYCQGVERVWKGWTNPAVGNKGMILVSFVSHRAAALARSELLRSDFRLWGYKLSVDWAEPDGPVEKFFKDTPQVLRVDNVKYQITARTLINIFNEGSFNGVTQVIRRRSTAYIYFCSRGQAEAAKVALNNYNLGGRQITVKWWNPGKVPVAGPNSTLVIADVTNRRGSKRVKKNLCITSGNEHPQITTPPLSLEPAAAVTGKQRKLKVTRRRKSRPQSWRRAASSRSCYPWNGNKRQLALPYTTDIVCSDAAKEVNEELTPPASSSSSFVALKEKVSMNDVSTGFKDGEIACSRIELLQFEEQYS